MKSFAMWMAFLVMFLVVGTGGALSQKARVVTTGSTGQTTGQALPNKVIISSLVSVLQPSTNGPTYQVATLGLTCQYTPTGGDGIAGYQWSNAYPPPQGTQYPANAVLVTSGSTSKFATGQVTSPGIFWATCGILLQHADGTLDKQPSVFVQGNCAVIGGPLTLSVVPPPRGMPQPPMHDGNDLSMPFHLNNFGFDPTAANIPASYQLPQYQGSASMSSQPDATVFTWTVPSPLQVTSGGGTNTSNGSVGIRCLTPSGPVAITCTVSLNFTDVYGIQASGSGSDDTTSSPIPTFPSENLSNQFDCHIPDHMKQVGKVQNLADCPSGGTSCGDDYTYAVFDQLGQLQPAVWVQERWPAGTPPNLATNASSGVVWETKLTPCAFVDTVSYGWNPASQFSALSFSHLYFAGTNSTTGPGGIQFASYTTTWNPGNVNNSPSPGTTSNG